MVGVGKMVRMSCKSLIVKSGFMDDVVFKSPFSGVQTVPPNFASMPPCFIRGWFDCFEVCTTEMVNISKKIKCAGPLDDREIERETEAEAEIGIH